MNKLLLGLGTTLFFFNVAHADVVAADSVSVVVGTQTYQCSMTEGLKCNPVNAVQQQQITLKKNGGKIQIADSARGLSVDIATSVENNQVSYDATFCSNTVCTLSTNNGGVNGYIDQTMFGQYNITEKTFYVLGFFITSQNKTINLKEKVMSRFSNLK